jgi:anaerobic selenocysteine-containing dehydrogenase
MKAMTEGVPYQVRAFLVFGNNALTTYANARETQKALESVEFLTVTDFFMMPTAEMADIVLPACSWPEIEGLHLAPFWSEYVVGPIQKAVQVEERRSDPDIFADLAQRLNLELGQESSDDVYAAQLARGSHKVDWDDLRQSGSFAVPFEYRKHEKRGRFETPTGKIEFYCTTLEEMGYDPLPYYEEPPESPVSAPEVAKDFPLVLTTGHRSPFFFHSEGRQITRLRKGHKDPRLEIHPDTAAALRIADGEWVWIETLRGKVKQRAKYAAALDPRVVAAEHGWWFPENLVPDHGVWESNINVVTSNKAPFDPAMGTYQLRGLLCRVERVAQ